MTLVVYSTHCRARGKEAVGAGWKTRWACHVLELGEVRSHRWYARRARGRLADTEPGGSPMHGILPEEAEGILALFEEWGEVDRSHRELAHRGSAQQTPRVRVLDIDSDLGTPGDEE